MKKHKNPLPNLVAVSFVAIILLFLIVPCSLSARTTTRSFPDLPWNGMKVNVTADGNFVFGSKQDHVSDGGLSIAAYRNQENFLCSDGVINSITLAGNTLTTYNGNPSDFFHVQRDISIFYYPAGSNEPTSVHESSQEEKSLLPIFDWPFNITAPLPPGVDIGFQIALQVCEWGDPGHTYLSCKLLYYDAITIDHSSGPDLCFQVEKFTPSDQSKNVDFDQPAITATFTTPFDPDSINEDTLTVFYWDKNGNKAYVDGSYEFSDDRKVATFIPSGGLLDGVYYVAEVWGETDAKAVNRSNWVKGANGGSLKTGKIWSFWTMPDLTDKVTLVPVQAVENASLVKGKPTVLKVFLRWDNKWDVHPDWQLKTLDTDIRLSWWENNNGQFDTWASTGQGRWWTPHFGTPVKREYLNFTNVQESYNKSEKLLSRDSVNYYGFKPGQEGLVTFEAEVEPLGQNPPAGRRPRTFTSEKVDRPVKSTRGLRYSFIPFDIGNWGNTNMTVPCPVGVSGDCVNIEYMVNENLRFVQSIFPMDPDAVIRNSNLTAKKLYTSPDLIIISPTKASESDWRYLLAKLNRSALASGTIDIFVGLFPQDWLGLPGVTYPEGFLGIDYYRNAILMGHGARWEILAHETGHILPETDWGDYDYSLAVGEGFNAQWRDDYRSSVREIPGNPPISGIYQFMYRDIDSPDHDYWIALWQYQQIFQNRIQMLAQANSDLSAGEPLLLISGTVDTGTNSVTFKPWYLLEPGASWVPNPGEYTLQFLNGAGSLLASHPFSTTQPADGKAFFLLKVPYPTGTTRIRITYQGNLIREDIPSANAPQVSITTPIAGAVWPGVRTIAWTGSDADPGTVLNYLLSISTDNRQSWRVLNMDLADDSFVYDTRDSLNSATCYLRVTATDGINSTTSEVGPFTISNAPRLEFTSPVNGQGGVKRETRITIGFSEAINPTTIKNDTFYLLNSLNQKVSGTISYDPNTFQAVFVPAASLSFSSSYSVVVTTGILSQQGGRPLESGATWSFNTEADIYSPQITQYFPKAGDDKVSLNAALITVRFDQPMNPSTLNSQTVSLKTAQGGSVDGTIHYNPDTYTLTFRPSNNLAPETKYQVTVEAAIADSTGHTLESPFNWSFQTGTENTSWVRLGKNIKDYLWDQDGDGSWDYLVIEVEVSVLFTSTYNLKGWLLNKNGQAIAQATSGNIALAGGTHLLSLYFTRQDIQKYGGEGPYYFADAVIYDLMLPSSGDSQGDPHLTHFTNYTADANLLLFAYPDPGVLGKNLTFYASVDNQGASSASGVALTATLPSSVDFVSAATGQGVCTQAAGVVTCTIGTLGSLQSNLVSIVVTPKEKGWINFSASITSVQDSYVANNNQQLSLEIGYGGNVLYLPLIMNQ